eukprot:NODE_122_length_18870_cov_0.236908.p9 type:complete len:201 gc:universal NODE_122_length_18870_cov_0.236908:9291-8689(-)
MTKCNKETIKDKVATKMRHLADKLQHLDQNANIHNSILNNCESDGTKANPNDKQNSCHPPFIPLLPNTQNHTATDGHAPSKNPQATSLYQKIPIPMPNAVQKGTPPNCQEHEQQQKEVKCYANSAFDNRDSQTQLSQQYAPDFVPQQPQYLYHYPVSNARDKLPSQFQCGDYTPSNAGYRISQQAVPNRIAQSGRTKQGN